MTLMRIKSLHLDQIIITQMKQAEKGLEFKPFECDVANFSIPFWLNRIET